MSSPNEGDLKRLQMQVCDNCRFRKTKCDRGLPCNSCAASSICCQYLHTPRRKGPRGGKGRRLLQIRQGLREFDKNQFEVSTLAHVHLETALEAGDSPPLPEATIGSSSMSPTSSRRSQEQVAIALTSTIRSFMRNLLPIMPVVDEAELVSDSQRFDELPPPRQCLLLSLCAATRIQLKLDRTKDRDESEIPVNTYLHSPLTGKGLLAAAKRLRRQFDIVDNISLDAILTSFFLFAAHGNLEEHHHAAFCLNESITLAMSLGLHSDETYIDFPKRERELRRRIFWLLFVTERTYALQRRRPVMLRSTIVKPQIVDTECPALMHDFVNHIRLFEHIPHTLYDWLPTNDPLQQQGSAVKISQRVADMLCMVQPGDSVLESQRFDTLVTQQWLRVSMWRLAFGRHLGQMRWHTEPHTLGVPFDAGRSIMGHLEFVRQASKDCHGIAIVGTFLNPKAMDKMDIADNTVQEQKLFDIGISLSDASVVAAPTPSFEFGPVDLLYSIVKCLGHIRGCKSPLLPELLKHCGGLLPSTTLTAQLDMPAGLYEEVSELHGNLIMDCEVTQTEDACTDEQWDPENCSISQFEDLSSFNALPCEGLVFDAAAAEG